jgi:2-oxoglutarate dehydrogenase E1 component
VLDQVKAKHARPRYAGRPASAATATGLAKKHAQEQKSVVDQALGT